MKFGMGYWLVVLVCLSGVSAGAEVAPSRDPMAHFFVSSFGNLQEELAQAKAEGKTGILVMFNDPDCPWCQKMKATVLNRPQVQDYYRKHFHPLHVDTRGDTLMTDFNGREMTEKDFAFNEHRVRATPVFIFFDIDGKQTLRYTGAVRDVDEFLWLGEFVAGGEYKTKNFTAYKRERRANFVHSVK